MWCAKSTVVWHKSKFIKIIISVSIQQCQSQFQENKWFFISLKYCIVIQCSIVACNKCIVFHIVAAHYDGISQWTPSNNHTLYIYFYDILLIIGFNLMLYWLAKNSPFKIMPNHLKKFKMDLFGIWWLNFKQIKLKFTENCIYTKSENFVNKRELHTYVYLKIESKRHLIRIKVKHNNKKKKWKLWH